MQKVLTDLITMDQRNEIVLRYPKDLYGSTLLISSPSKSLS